VWCGVVLCCVESRTMPGAENGGRGVSSFAAFVSWRGGQDPAVTLCRRRARPVIGRPTTRTPTVGLNRNPDYFLQFSHLK
jgi:hypothetical protein